MDYAVRDKTGDGTWSPIRLNGAFLRRPRDMHTNKRILMQKNMISENFLHGAINTV